MEQQEYENLRNQCISKYKTLYKDSLVFDICEVPKDIRILLLSDEFYLTKTKAIKANLFHEQLEILDKVLAGCYTTDATKDSSQTVLKALEMKNKLLLEDLNVTRDESNSLNVTYIAMSKEDFERAETVEVFNGSNSTELGADFGVTEDNSSFEARMKAKTQEKLKELEGSKDNNGSNS